MAADLTLDLRSDRHYGAALLRDLDIPAIGEFARATIVARIKRGLGSSGAPMRPLSARDARWKSRHGLRPVRDLTGDGKEGGHMLDGIIVQKTSGTSVTITFAAGSAIKKAAINEAREAFFCPSPDDARRIAAFAQQQLDRATQKLEQRMLARWQWTA